MLLAASLWQFQKRYSSHQRFTYELYSNLDLLSTPMKSGNYSFTIDSAEYIFVLFAYQKGRNFLFQPWREPKSSDSLVFRTFCLSKGTKFLVSDVTRTYKQWQFCFFVPKVTLNGRNFVALRHNRETSPPMLS